MPRRAALVRALAAGAAGLAGGAAAALLLLPGGGPQEAASTTVPATTTSTVVPWVNRHETRLGPAVVVPTGLQLESGKLLFTYDLVPITPLAGGAPPEEELELAPPAAPASLVVTFTGGASSTAAVAPGQTAGWFDVPADLTLDQVEGIAVTSYWIAAPAGYTVELSPSTGAWVSIAPGVTARIAQVLEQAENRVVIVEFDDEGSRGSDLSIVGEGRDWLSSSSSLSGGGQRWTLDFRGAALPDPVTVVVRGVVWVEIAGGGSLDLAGLPR